MDIGVSVVIPCRNSAGTIGAQLEALSIQNHRGAVEVIVADNGSTDDLATLVSQYRTRLPHLRLVDASGRVGVNHARNRGVDAAEHDLILLCDADDVVSPDWVREMAEVLIRCDLVGGTVVGFRGDPAPHASTAETPHRLSTLGFLPHPIGANCGFTKRAWRAIGGFDESFVGGADEIDFFWRAQLAGFRLKSASDAIVSYRLRTERRSLVRQARRTSLGTVRLYKRHRTHGFRRRNPILGFSRRIGRIVVDLPGALRGGDALTRWLCHCAALEGHFEGAVRFRTFCP